MALASSTYQMNKVEGGKYGFSVKAAELSNWIMARLMAGGFAGWLAAGVMSVLTTPLGWGSFLNTVRMVLIAGAFLYVAYKVFIISKGWFDRMDRKQRGSDNEFVVGDAGIELQGLGLIPRDRIHRLILRNSVSNAEIPYAPGMIVGGSGMMGMGMAVGSAVGHAMTSAMVAAANAQRQKRSAVAYRVDVEHGGVSTTLAGGLTESTAFGLMTDVGKVLGMQ